MEEKITDSPFANIGKALGNPNKGEGIYNTNNCEIQHQVKSQYFDKIITRTVEMAVQDLHKFYSYFLRLKSLPFSGLFSV